ncbi:hypothetical protein [Deinococcus humi]|uniref:Uncharacterized protein n=1 Tax=Deinococcus humi TaxID=662880 RepID=A0A7W8JX53_9DEIO|nr:hypothetical protein [Deinococcus humi]MBB5364872.1 hypothetical protein [Deinococcus humi]
MWQAGNPGADDVHQGDAWVASPRRQRGRATRERARSALTALREQLACQAQDAAVAMMRDHI